MPVRIALDAMGGDFAPAETVRASIETAGDDLQVVLFGDKDRLIRELSTLPSNNAVSIVHASQAVSMDESPVEAYRRKPDSSLRRALDAARAGQVLGVVTAGNTGAAMTAAYLTLGAADGVERPGIATALPTVTGRALLMDAGANVDCNATHLYQFALMGSIYLQMAWDMPSPRVGLLNIGEEASKGNALSKLAYERLKNSSLNFVGNIEARELFAGAADLVVCDGFAGNVLLKAAEGVAEMIRSALLDLGGEVGEDMIEHLLQRLRNKMDYAAYGGAPLLGLDGVCFIAHGRSGATAISSALRAAAQCVCSGAISRIQERLRAQA